MEIIKSCKEDNVIFSLSGKLDANTAPQFESEINDYFSEGNTSAFTVDMEKVTYVSSAGLRALLSAQKKANAGKVSMTIKNVSASIQEILDITGFSGILNVI